MFKTNTHRPVSLDFHFYIKELKQWWLLMKKEWKNKQNSKEVNDCLRFFIRFLFIYIHLYLMIYFRTKAFHEKRVELY